MTKYNVFDVKGKKYAVKRNCKRCYGRGNVGFDVDKGHYVLCSCVRIMKEEEKVEKQATPASLLSEDTSDSKPRKGGDTEAQGNEQAEHGMTLLKKEADGETI